MLITWTAISLLPATFQEFRSWTVCTESEQQEPRGSYSWMGVRVMSALDRRVAGLRYTLLPAGRHRAVLTNL